ncbi:MAG: MMPL family transporter [Proteobacteria bacterium]|nr:MMPL family transporter [Pseudomonadota bacterium]
MSSTTTIEYPVTTASSNETTPVKSLNITGRIANFSARHRWTMLGAWVVVLVAAIFAAGSIADVTTSEASGSSTESGVAAALIAEHINTDDTANQFVLVEFDNGTASSSVNKAFISSLAAELEALEHVAGVVTYVDGAEQLLSEDKKTALIPVTLTVTNDEAVDIIVPFMAIVEEANESAGFRVTTIGQGSVEAEFARLAEETMVKGESIGIALALVILLIVFGAAVAAGLPILLAIISIIVAIALSSVIGRVLELNEFVVQIISMIGLAVGIDYALFIVKRYGEELENGMDKIAAITKAGNTAGRTVMVSGFAVMIALGGMLVVPDLTFRSFGLGAILVVIAAVVAASTLLPAVLSVLGHRVFWLRIPFIGRKANVDSNNNGVWDKITNTVIAHPVISVVLTGGTLLAASLMALTMNLGSSGLSMLPEESPTLHAYELMNSEFTEGTETTNIVIAAPDVSTDAVQAGIEALKISIANDPFYGDVAVTVSPNNDLVVISAVMQGDSSGDLAAESVERLRDQFIPNAFDQSVATVYVGGEAAFAVDAVNQMSTWLPIVFALVLGSSFVLLLVIFRSIVVPIKAVLMNVLSVGAAYGLMVLVFQKGIGADLLGFETTPVIEYGLPLFLFSIIFGLSMDYHVFLLSRIKERYDETGDNKASVAFGLRSTAGIITGAALIMVGVFGGFALGDMSVFQQMGFGLAAAVIIDATLVRSILVPASMVLLGDKNWYFPSWLEWIPRIDAEGEHQVEAEVAGSGQPASTPTPVPAAAIEFAGN